jgi:predicted secreted Zn-dependent protease
MRERYIRKLQKNRHLAEISFNILTNSTFRNLTRAERGRMAKLIYKAELMELEVKSKDVAKTMTSFQDMIKNIQVQLLDELDEDDDDFPDKF